MFVDRVASAYKVGLEHKAVIRYAAATQEEGFKSLSHELEFLQSQNHCVKLQICDLRCKIAELRHSLQITSPEWPPWGTCEQQSGEAMKKMHEARKLVSKLASSAGAIAVSPGTADQGALAALKDLISSSQQLHEELLQMVPSATAFSDDK